jgi:hypothetical protein
MKLKTTLLDQVRLVIRLKHLRYRTEIAYLSVEEMQTLCGQ